MSEQRFRVGQVVYFEKYPWRIERISPDGLYHIRSEESTWATGAMTEDDMRQLARTAPPAAPQTDGNPNPEQG